MKTNSNFINCIVMMIVMALSSMGTMAQQTYISDVYIRYGGEHKWDDKDPLPDGYIMIDQDLNEHQGGDYVYLCYKTTTDIREAITDLIVIKEWDVYSYGNHPHYSGKLNKSFWVDGREYHAAAYSENSDGGRLNQGIAGDPKWLYYTKQGSADKKVCKPSAITSLELKWEPDDDLYKDISYLRMYVYSFITDNSLVYAASLSFSVGIIGQSNSCLYAKVTRSSDENHIARQLTEAKEPTCTTAGNIESWRCIDCGRYFDDSYTTEYSPEETVIPALGHD